jgi:replicative DNA helicase
MITRSLKILSKELNIPVIALSQLNRSVESRSSTSKKPQLSDLRESGAIEQDADMVLFIYRPEYYNLDTFDDGNPSAGLADLVIAKHRNGSLGEIRLRFIADQAKFCDTVGDYSALYQQQQQSTSITLQSRINNIGSNGIPDELPY